jgi:transcriptional regulator with GAF, ATPase, and Fis domain
MSVARRVRDREVVDSEEDDNILKFELSQAHSLTIRARAFVFSDPRSKALLPLIERTAPSDASILITGETGTGKELVARYVHRLSGRASQPFVALNCGAFSETLIESELFGHEKGAFTGAVGARPGWFEAANGGTLFLDEIGDLPLALQVKLLRVLQEHEIVRLGARTPIPLNVRVIAATNVDLRKAVAAGRFREDLFYRLHVVTLPLLPLRERRADILPLARHFLSHYSDRLAIDLPRLSAEAEDVLFGYAWPGNIRELENTIHRAALVCCNGVISSEDLALPHESSAPLLGRQGDLAEYDDDPVAALRPAIERLFAANEPAVLDRVTELLIREALLVSGNNQVRTASLLGVTRNVVRTYLKRFGVIGADR